MLKLLACLDSIEMGKSCQPDLDIPRKMAVRLGVSAVEAGLNGRYFTTDSRSIDWSHQVQVARASKVSIPPEAPLPAPSAAVFNETRIQVTNETTLGAALRLVEAGIKPAALNFANGIHPGGGFLAGARAQEETVCRSSALYQTLVGDEMYADHRRRPRPDSTDWAIYSPGVPIFRTDDGRELERPWLLDFITCAAPYARAIGQIEASDLLRYRIRRVLAIARAYEQKALVLGAWGCGAFGNDPHQTAVDFRYALESESSNAFGDIVFAITDWSPDRKFLRPFCEVFSPNAE